MQNERILVNFAEHEPDMLIMKLKILLTLSLLIGVCSASFAVTDAEMEQARAITAKNYLRWVNNGSGYLDDLKGLPKSVDELKKSLKEKEKENLKKFEAVTVAKDYASWDKKRLIAYWSETFLASPGLDPVGKGSKSRTAKHIAQMNVSAPAEKPAEEPTLEETSVQARSEATTDSVSDAIAAEMALAKQDSAALATAEEITPAEEDPDALRPKKSNATWIYVGILILLVIVVVILVIYAARAMKGNAQRDDDSDEIGENSSENSSSSFDSAPSYVPSDSVSRKEHEFMIERKNEKIRKVKAELDVVREENARLQASISSLENRLSRAQTQIESMRLSLSESETRSAGSARQSGTAKTNSIRSLYLGRVNKNGLFVRADRQINPEGTVYRLDTEDGYAGSFVVVNSPEVVERALGNPDHWLIEGCIIDAVVPADEATEIITESSGTAVIENGCWKVIRKAKVRLA